jgi:hypothetical protein
MSALLSGVVGKVRQMMPDYANRWGDDFIESIVALADSTIREEAETVWMSTDIELNNYALWYSLPNSVVCVSSVQFSRDGVTWDTELTPISIDELDHTSNSWNDDYGLEPTNYCLWCAPGTSNWARIMLWPAISATSGETVRVNYVGCYPATGDLAAVDVPDWVQDAVYVPYTMAMLVRNDDPSLASDYLSEYSRKLPDVCIAYRVKRGERHTNFGGEN